MSVITEVEWRALEGVIKKYFSQQMEKMEDHRPKFFNMDTSNRSVEEHHGYGAIGGMTKWTGQVDYKTMDKGFKKDYRHDKFSTGIKIDEELLRFENYSQIKKMVNEGLVNAAYYSKQRQAADVFNNAFDVAYPGADAVALCSASHPYSPSNPTTQSNAGSSALTIANVNTARKKMVKFTNDQGEILARNPNVIIVGEENRLAAQKIVGSKLEPENANNGINVFGNGELKVLYDPFIHTNSWFLADEMIMKQMLNWYTARETNIELDKDFNTEQASYKLVGMWSYGWDDYSFIYGNKIS